MLRRDQLAVTLEKSAIQEDSDKAIRKADKSGKIKFLPRPEGLEPILKARITRVSGLRARTQGFQSLAC